MPHLAPPATWVGVDKAVHLVEYGVLGFLLRRAMASRGGAGIIAAIAIATLVGTLDEVYQSTVPGRYPSVFDALADFLGGSLGAFFYPMIAGRAVPPPGGSSTEGAKRRRQG